MDWADALRVVGTRTDVLAIRLLDPADESLPGDGPVRLSDPTTGEILDVDIDDTTRRRYETAAREHSERVTAALRSARARIVELRTDRDWVLDFARQMAPGRGGAR